MILHQDISTWYIMTIIILTECIKLMWTWVFFTVQGHEQWREVKDDVKVKAKAIKKHWDSVWRFGKWKFYIECLQWMFRHLPMVHKPLRQWVNFCHAMISWPLLMLYHLRFWVSPCCCCKSVGLKIERLLVQYWPNAPWRNPDSGRLLLSQRPVLLTPYLCVVCDT